MSKFLSWIPNCIFWLMFGFILLVFHPLQVIAIKISESAHTKVVNTMIWFLNQALWIVGNRITYHIDLSQLPTGVPYILVSNHQSMFDIPGIGWAFRKYNPKFIAKKSLGQGIPSISYNIRHGGSTTVPLDNARVAISAIEKFGKKMNKKQYMAVIFPEGARARDGVPFPFKTLGLTKLMREMPTATIVPVVLHRFWKFEQYRCKPVPFGTKMELHMLTPVKRTIDDKEIIANVEAQMVAKINDLNSKS